MTTFTENILPEQYQIVKLYIKHDEKITHKVGYWQGNYWCYITNPPNVTSYRQSDVIGWEKI